MNHLTVKRAWWSDQVSEFGQVRYGLELMSGSCGIQWLADSVEEAESKAREPGSERGVPAELLTHPKYKSDEEYAQEREERRVAELEALKQISVSNSWGINPELVDTLGWPQLDQGNPAENGWIPASGRLAAVASDNSTFRATPASVLIKLGDSKPNFRGEPFGIVNHPVHGRIAVTSAEFCALDLPEAN